MAGWVELSKSSDGQFRFVLKAGNAETILTSELYKAMGSAENGIASRSIARTMHVTSGRLHPPVRRFST